MLKNNDGLPFSVYPTNGAVEGSGISEIRGSYSNVRRYSIKEMINTSRIRVIMRTPMP